MFHILIYQAVEFKGNPYTYSNETSSTTREVTSDVLSLDLKDDEDELMVFEETDDNFIIFVKNDMRKVGKDSAEANEYPYSHKDSRTYGKCRWSGTRERERQRSVPPKNVYQNWTGCGRKLVLTFVHQSRSHIASCDVLHICSGIKLVPNIFSLAPGSKSKLSQI